MKIADIKNLTPAELGARKRELKNEIFHLRLQQQSGQLENPNLLRELRREIARVETIATQKAHAAAATAAAAK
jgi:large subunit ribosomal protein L29